MSEQSLWGKACWFLIKTRTNFVYWHRGDTRNQNHIIYICRLADECFEGWCVSVVAAGTLSRRFPGLRVNSWPFTPLLIVAFVYQFALPALFGRVEPYRVVVQACSWYRSRGVMKPQKPYPVSVAFGSVRWIATKVADALLLYVLLMRNYQKTNI